MLEVGYAASDITPGLGISLGGYGFYLDRRAEAILDPLLVRAISLRTESEAAVLISADLVGLSVQSADELRHEVANACSISAVNVMLACTHTHSAPLTQAMPGLGELDADYVALVRRKIVEAAKASWADLQPCRVSSCRGTVEPIGYNRRRGDFTEIDPVLKVLVFETGRGKIFLLSYACHLVTLGRSTLVSADWAGWLVRKIEEAGHRAVFFQGFCGDVDPVVNLNAWATGGKEDVELYATILAQRALGFEGKAEPEASPALRVRERRFAIPLRVGRKAEIDGEAERFLHWNRRFPNADRFAEEWKLKAYEEYDRIASHPYVERVPIQAIAIGEVKILGIPAEVFSALGLRLQRKWPKLFPLGYANGDIGYIPTRKAYDHPGDYASYCAPKFYTLFPFVPEVEEIVLREADALLAGLER